MGPMMIGEAAIHVERTGDAATTLVFVHGMCGGGWVWEDQVGRLSDRFTCVTYDRRGHTRSEAGSNDQSIARHAADLRAIVEALGPVRPVLVGSSSGAAIVIEALHHDPDMAVGALLSEPPLFCLDPHVGEALLAEIDGVLRPTIQRDGIDAAAPAFLGVVAPGLWDQLDDGRRERYRQNAPLIMASLTAPPSALGPEDVAAITTPACVVAGARSGPLRDLARTLAATLPDATYVELPDTNHATYVQAPAAFAETVARFADRVASAAPTPN